MSPSRSRRALATLCAAAAIPAAALAAPGIAAATPMIESSSLAVSSGAVTLGTNHVEGNDPLGGAFYKFDVAGKATWSGNLPDQVGWNSSYVRQGATLGVSRMSLLQSGKLHVTWHVTGNFYNFGETTVDKTYAADVSCIPMLSGGGYTCHAQSPKMNLERETGVPNGRYVNMVFHTTFSITPKGAIVSRALSVSGMPDVTAGNLSLSPTLGLDTPKVPCGAVGSPVSYKLAPVHYKPGVAATQSVELQEGMMDAVTGLIETPALYDKVVGTPLKTTPAFDLAGPGHSTNLGLLQANNIPPTISAVGPFAGTAGTPITLKASVSGQCAIDSYNWHFSNGTTSYGPTPQRTFATPGVYDGELTVTDHSGLKATRSFTVTVS